ncbi:MAG: lamin tail domain-containing protein [Verrucomicrobiae bacterium]|nr:lamin tail domain-containing protein [Verrucomicrobiae bacterium]
MVQAAHHGAASNFGRDEQPGGASSALAVRRELVDVMRSLVLMAAVLCAAVLPVRGDATLVFNEVMYHPLTNEAAMEWVELYNQLAVDLDVSGWRLEGEIDYVFPAGTRVAGRGFVVVAIQPAAFTAATGLTNVLGPFNRRLSNAGGTLLLKNNNGRIMDRLDYGTTGEWPVAADGAGPSLAKIDEELASRDPANWRASLSVGGSPGMANTPRLTITTQSRTLVPVDAVWRYEESGTDRGAAWRNPEYDDSSWPQGAALLAREDCNCLPEPIRTPLTVGANKLTYYFRTTFVYTGEVSRATLALRHVVDDGVVVYLNGVEVWRLGVNDPVTSTTLASRTVNDAAYEGPFGISAASLRPGTNILAAEVHQVNSTSSDVVFGLQLEEVTYVTNAPGGVLAPDLTVALNELPAVTNQQFWVELYNYGRGPVALDGCVLARFGTHYAEYVLPARTLEPGERWVLQRATVGFGADDGDRVVFYAPGKGRVYDAVVAKNHPQARHPEGTGSWLVPRQTTPGTTNEVWLRRDVVINEIMYHHQPYPAVGDLPPEENPEEWLELYNRGTNPVDLTGWRLEGAVRYDFPEGKLLAPGAYLVVARDAIALRATFPGVDILGNYSGRLSSEDLPLRLLDAQGNPAAVVRFYSWGRWPKYADGGGSSLELRNPFSDPASAEAWAASEEGSKGGWRTYTYRMTAQASTTANPDSVWREFILGLQAAGECLVDDIRVIQSPTNNPVEMIANGNFENGLAGWRVLGTHMFSRVIEDPDQPGNRVLYVVASGPQEHMHNHIATTLKDGLSVTDGREYEISYRAKWLGGSRLLNTRLWFNRVARTTELEAPQRNGTPGARNSRYEANPGPTFAGLAHEPVVPPVGAPVTVRVRASDPQGVSQCQVYWSVNSGAWSNAPMSLSAEGDYQGVIPGYSSGAVVQFYVRAVDGLGAAATFPAEGPQGGALYKVNDGQATAFPGHTFRIITTPALAAWLHQATNVMSNHNWPCTVIYNERVAYYNVGLRLKSSMNGRPFSNRVGFHLAFQPDQKFRGVHPTMGLDRRPGDSSPVNEEIVVRHLALVAGGIPTMHLDVARVLSPRGTENGPALLTPSYEDEFIATAFQEGERGMLFEMEGVYYSTSATSDGYKLPQPNATQYVDLTDHGNDKENYRYYYLRKNQRASDDYRPIMALGKAFSLSGTALENQTRQLMDLPEWLRAYALITLCGVNDTYTFWLNHNVMIYFRPEDHKAVYLMWDNDFTFTRSATDVIVGGQNLGRIINLPANLRQLYAHLQDLMDTYYNTNYLAYWLAHYGPFSSATYTHRASYIQQRSDYVRSVIAGAGGNSVFSVVSTNVSVAGSNVVTLTGTAPVTVQNILVNGVAWPVTWNSVSSWTLRLPVSAATNRLQITATDLRGRVLSNAAATVQAVVNVTPDSPAGNVIFTEIMAQPLQPGAEYVELFNRSVTTSFDMSGWRINGLDYTFPPGSYLAPRSYLVLVKNRWAYLAAYGLQAPLFDEYPGNLQAGGETLTLLMPGAEGGAEVVVDRVRYEGDLPWPAAAVSGTGSAYQLIDVNQDNARAGNWTAQYVPPVYEPGVYQPARTNSGWRQVVLTGSIGVGVGGGAQRLLIYLGETNGASAIIDDICLVEGTNAAVGFNYVRNGDFELPLVENPVLTNSWLIPTNYTNTAIVSSPVRSGQGALRLECTTFGNSYGRVISQNLSPAPAPNTICTLSFWFWSTNSATNLVVRIQNSAALTTGGAGTNILPVITPEVNLPPRLVSPAVTYRTPGTANQFAATLPAFPPLWLNEVAPMGTAGCRDAAGEEEPWVEIYNAGSQTVSLQGLYLSSNYSNLTQWAFPSGASLGPGQYLVVFCDGQPAQSTAQEWHANFRLSPAGGGVALSRLHNGQPQVLDYVNYRALPDNRSYGSYPDGQPFARQQFIYPTPAAPNDPRRLPLVVFINEWMASNQRTLQDPVDGDYEDWFELYNPGTQAVDLADCYLTDTLTNRFKYRITTNGAHLIPPQGYLLVWADEETAQNTDAQGRPRADLHVNFKLSAAGEAIGLYAADGTAIDTVEFGVQTNDVSMGRLPDGGPELVFMPGSASPRGPNWVRGGNLAPVVVPVANRTVFVGQTLGMLLSASDPDGPTQTLRFSLEPGAPSGAQVTADGYFSWLPTLEGLYVIAVRVTDNGQPPLSATTSFLVEVLPRPVLGKVGLQNGCLDISWPSRPGLVYVLDYKERLDAPAWTPFLTNRAGGETLRVTNITVLGPQGYFRLRTSAGE